MKTILNRPLSNLAITLIIILLMLQVPNSVALEGELRCDGKHMLALEENNDHIECAIIIDDQLIFPRNLVAHGSQIWLVDKGSNLFINGKNNGSIYHYQKSNDGYFRSEVLGSLDDPNDIAIRKHSDDKNWVYFTTRDKVQRIKATPTSSETSIKVKPETIITNLPTQGWHKLGAIHLTQDALFLTVPSATDHCEVEGINGLVEYPCSEEENGTAVIRKYTFEEDKLSPKYEIVAQGLRDALAVQLSPNKEKLIVADNGWDQVDLSDTEYEYVSTPHDEINIIDLSNVEHFGWPYCFDNDLVIPPYRRFVKSCEGYQPPHILLPAHSAPLNMMYFNNELLVNLHGNSQAGGKTVSFALNKEGIPLVGSTVKLNWHYNIIAGIGRPFGLSQTNNNELLLTDDWNHQLIKVIFKEN